MTPDYSKPKNKKKLFSILRAVVLMVIGVLFCLSPVINSEKALSYVLGIGFIVTGIVYLIVSYVVRDGLISFTALVGYMLLALGVFSIIESVMTLIFNYVPYLTLTVGAGVLADAFLGKFKRKEGSKALFIIKIIVAVLLIALGVCFLVITDFRKYASVALGVVIISYAIYDFVGSVKNRKAACKSDGKVAKKDAEKDIDKQVDEKEDKPQDNPAEKEKKEKSPENTEGQGTKAEEPVKEIAAEGTDKE